MTLSNQDTVTDLYSDADEAENDGDFGTGVLIGLPLAILLWGAIILGTLKFAL